MTQLNEIVDELLLGDMIEQGYINVQHHPSEPLTILNYSRQTTFEQKWNQATILCRGLIVNHDTNEVVARPFPKFFNWNEPSAPKIELDVPVWATDKMDGSLGIRYWAPRAKRWCIATRGSFTSEQAMHATKRLDDYYGGVHEPPTYEDYALTQLFEIVYPENRIVLDYGQRDELVALGVVDTQSGYVFPACEISDPDMPQAAKMPAETFGDVLKLEPRKNAEGVVVITKLDSCQVMLKIKQEDYVKLHKMLSHLNERTIWERLRNGDSPDDIKYGLPEEFWAYIDDTCRKLLSEFASIEFRANMMHRDIMLDLQAAGNWTRRDYAEMVKLYQNKDLLFRLLDGKDITDVIWKKIRPAASGGPFKGDDE